MTTSIIPTPSQAPPDGGASVSRLAVRRVAIDTWRENVAYLHRDCAVYRAEGFQALSKIEVRANGRRILATVNVVDDLGIVACDELGLSEDAFALLGVEAGYKVAVAQAEPPESMGALFRKIAGERLRREDLRAIVRDIAEHRYSKIELTAFVVACNRDELDREEVFFLSDAMVATGQRLDWHEGLVVDKHCIGGIPGNRTSMLVVPIVAAHGMLCPKTSSRAITSPAGTADTMEVLANVELPLQDLQRIVRDHRGCLAWGGHGPALARRRCADLCRTPAVDRLAGADGGVHPVEEDRRRLHPPGARHPYRPHGQSALHA